MKLQMSSSNNSVRGYLYLIITFTLWGSLYVVSKFVLTQLPAFTISFLRFLLASICLTLISPKPKKTLLPAHIPYVLVIGVGGYFIGVGSQLLGTKYAGASMASLINSLNPITMSVFGALILNEKLTPRKVIGILFAVLGVYIIIGGNTKTTSLTGVFLSLFSVLIWSFVSVLARKITSQYEPLYITRLAVQIAALCYFPVSMIEIYQTRTPVLSILLHTPSCTFSLLYMGIACTGIAYLLWNKSLSIFDAGTCSSFYPLQPVISAMLGVLLLGESLTKQFLAGSVLIVFGVMISLLHTKSKPMRSSLRHSSV